MPVFHAHLPEGRFSSAQKRALGAALPQALEDALGIPAQDQFVTIAEHAPDSLHIDPSYGLDRSEGSHQNGGPDQNEGPDENDKRAQRSEDALIIQVLFTAERPLADRRALVAKMCELTVAALGVQPEDVFIALVPVPIANFSFGRGELQLAPDSE